MNRYFWTRVVAIVAIFGVLWIYQSKAVLWKEKEIENAKVIEKIEKHNKEIQRQLADAKGNAKRLYKDGTYEGSADGFGGEVSVSVTIVDDEITKVEIVSAKGEDASYLSQASKLLEDIVKQQSVDIDTVSGATYSSKGILGGAKVALEKAK